MDLLTFVQEYILSPYPSGMSPFRWRSTDSLAAVDLLRQRVALGDVGGTRTALDYLLGGPPPVGDGAVAALQALDRTGRLWGLLSSVPEAINIPADFSALPQLRGIWAANTQAVTGLISNAALDTIGWLAYFYKEKGPFNRLSAADKTRLVDFLNVFYTRPATLDANVGIPNLFASSMAANNFLQANALPRRSDGVGGPARLVNLGALNADTMPMRYKVWQFFYREAMHALLRSGFVPMAECNDQHQIVGAPNNAALTDHNGFGNLGATQALVNGALQSVGAAATYCWRGDTRSPGEVREVGGLWCKAESEGYAIAKNMRKAWHPFNDRECRKFMYFRINQNDNCLYTAVSVTPAVTLGVNQRFQFQNFDLNAFRLNACFPQLEEIPLTDRKAVRVHVQAGGGASTAIYFVDEVQLYLCRLAGGTQFVDTHWVQEQRNPGNGFPEIAVRGIPANALMGYLTFIRVHHRDDNISGFTAIPVDNRSRNMAPTNPQATAFYNAANVTFEAAWGPGGVQAPALPWNGVRTITQVGNMIVIAGRIANYAQYQTVL